jgi:hypothetical protein
VQIFKTRLDNEAALSTSAQTADDMADGDLQLMLCVEGESPEMTMDLTHNIFIVALSPRKFKLCCRVWVVHNHSTIFYMESETLKSMKNGKERYYHTLNCQFFVLIKSRL